MYSRHQLNFVRGNSLFHWIFLLPSTQNKYIFYRVLVIFSTSIVIFREPTQVTHDKKKQSNPLYFYLRSFCFLSIYLFSHPINTGSRRRWSSFNCSICFASAVTVRYESCAFIFNALFKTTRTYFFQ
jgi:hypothetical protein